MRLTYVDLDTGWEMVREGDELREIRDGDVAHTLAVAPIRSLEFHEAEVDKATGRTFYVLTINDNYPNDVVECESFRITV